jgi:hypothetical protein
MGDLVACLAGIKKLCDERDVKAVIHQRLNMPAFYYEGAKHPTKDDNGVQVCMNERGFEMIKPLLLSQYYIEDVVVWEGEKVDFNLDEIRNHFVNMPYGTIQRWYGYVYPQLFCDLSYPWMEVSAEDSLNDCGYGKIIINFTSRYRNPYITYFFLKDYLDKILFVGNDEEYETFCNAWDLKLNKLIVDDFKELMLYLDNCRLFLGNGSLCWNLAEAMKVPRILEASSIAPNCSPNGANGYEFYHQESLEYFFKRLNKQ